MISPEEVIDRLPILRCPTCGADLRPAADALTCRRCDERIPEEDGTLSMIGSTSLLNEAEVATQDHVSASYADARYKRDYSLRYHRSVLSRLTDEPAPRGIVLDDGCGPGLLLSHLTEHHPEVDQVVGIDVSRGMLRQARKHVGDTGAGYLFRADAGRLPFQDAAFDVVYARGLLHHLPDPSQGVEEICRVLKPGGTAVILEPNKTVVSALPRVLARRGKHFDRDHKNFGARYLARIVSGPLTIRRTTFFGYLAYFVLGFPDIVDFGRFLPMRFVAPALTRLDDFIARIPGLRRLGWGIVIVATRPERVT